MLMRGGGLLRGTTCEGIPMVFQRYDVEKEGM